MLNQIKFGLCAIAVTCIGASGEAEPVAKAVAINADGWFLTTNAWVDGCEAPGIAPFGEIADIRVKPDLSLALFRLETDQSTGTLPIRTVPLPSQATLFHPGASGLVQVTSFSGPSGDPSFLQISGDVPPGMPLTDAAGALAGFVTADGVAKTGALMDVLTSEGLGYKPVLRGAPIPDLSARLSSAMVDITCDVAPDVPEPPLETAKLQLPETFEIYENMDFLGADIGRIDNLSLAACETSCRANDQCEAFTYNRTFRICFLKEAGAIAMANPIAVAGARPSAQPNFTQTSIRMRPGVDSPGGDYLQLTDTNFEQCLRRCDADDRCTALAYVRRSRECWLKDEVSTLTRLPGVEFGQKTAP